MGYSRGYKWPEKVQGNAFGVKCEIEPDQAKKCIYPANGSLEERNEVKQMYQKTHGNWGPGEQRHRDYVWDPKFGNVQNHAFGYGEKRLLNGAAKAMMPERLEESFPKTVIVKKIVEDSKAVTTDVLGTVKNLGQGQTLKPADHVFGYRVAVDEWNAAKCINGEPKSIQDVDHDIDLGCSRKLNCTNQVRKPEDVGRSFGCPTIRTDIPFKAIRSISDYQNYGDEPEAVDLLFPSTFVELGVSEWDFQQPRPRQAIKELFEKIGYCYKVGKFNAIFNKAREISGCAEDKASVRAFMTAVQMYHDVE